MHFSSKGEVPWIAVAQELVQIWMRVNQKFMDSHLNKCVRAFGLDNVLQWIQSIHQVYHVPWVSVGCGNAAGKAFFFFKKTHFAVESCAKEINWRLCDPEPLSFGSLGLLEPYAPVQFKNVQELIQQEPTIVGHCVLFLNWPEPNDATYDYEAIQLLQPLAILATTELFLGLHGGGGSKSLFAFRQREEYSLITEATLQRHQHQMDFRLTWWQLPTMPPPTQTLPTKYKALVNNPEPCCIQ